MAKQEKSAAELYREERKARIAKAAKKNAKKQNKVMISKGTKKAIAVVVILAILAGIGAVVVNTSGVLERGKPAFNVGDIEVSSAEYGYYYSSAFNNYFQYSYQYDTYYGAGMGKLYTGYDYSIAPDQQKYEGTIEGVEEPMYTDFFADQAMTSIKYVKASVKYAEENGIELDDEDLAEVEKSYEEFKEGAKSINYSLAAYLRQFYHKGMTPALLKQIMTEQAITTKVSDVKIAEFADSYTDAKIEKTFYKDLKTYGVVSLRTYEYLAEKETVKAKEEGAADTQEVTDKTMAAAKAQAEAFAAKVSTVENFKEAAAAVEQGAGNEAYVDFRDDDAKTAMADISYSDLSYESSDTKFLDWAFDEDTKAGETYIVENASTGYSVYMMEKPVHKAPDYYTYDVRHILVDFPEEDSAEATEETEETEEKEAVTVEPLDTSKYDVNIDIVVNTDEYTDAELYMKAQDILKEYLDGAKTEEFFGELAAKYSADGNAAEGGIYEDVPEGKMVSEFEGWALEEGRVAGDVGIVETDYGYHVMYFIANEKTVWSDPIKNDLAEAEYNELAEELEKADNVKIDAIDEAGVQGVEDFVVSLAKEQIRNINSSAGHSADDGHNH